MNEQSKMRQLRKTAIAYLHEMTLGELQDLVEHMIHKSRARRMWPSNHWPPAPRQRADEPFIPQPQPVRED